MSRFAVTGVAMSGNLGGVAMLLTVRNAIRARWPSAMIDLLSITPRADRATKPIEGVRVVAAPWPVLIGVYLPLALAAWPLRRTPLARWALSPLPYFRALAMAEVVVDVSGIAFVDGRGLGLLAYNAACVLPALAMGRKVVKLSQTLGPFERNANRMIARWLLGSCAAVVGRGSSSAGNLARLGLRNAHSCPDITFCLRVRDEDREWAAQQLASLGIAGRPVVLSPSRVLERECSRYGIDLPSALSGAVVDLHARGEQVVLLAHSSSTGISKNDDLATCDRLLHALPDGMRIPVVYTAEPLRARAFIGLASAFVGCRYHALVSAYAEGVPSLALSWSPKYADLVELFGRSESVLESSDVGAWQLREALVRLLAEADQVRARILERLPGVRRASERNFHFIEEAIR